MKEREESKVKPKVLMVEEGALEKFAEVSIEGKDSISREDLLTYIRSNFKGLSLRNIASLQKIILPIQEDILEIAEDNSCLGNEVKM